MSENPIKPGTRCQCEDKKCPCRKYGHLENQPEHPFRMVTLKHPASANGYEVPMCAACAKYHEKGAKS